MNGLITDPVVWGLLAATVGTYGCRAVGVKLSGHIHQNSEIFRWLAAVTYAMVAALTVRMIVLPIGLLAQVPLWARVFICVASLAVMLSRPGGRLVPALLTGTLLMLGWGIFAQP